MAPEYVYQQRVSPKIDIFSYGVLLLQIVTRRRECSSDDSNTVNLITEVRADFISVLSDLFSASLINILSDLRFPLTG
jgi:serine/threonine protein kinase